MAYNTEIRFPRARSFSGLAPGEVLTNNNITLPYGSPLLFASNEYSDVQDIGRNHLFCIGDNMENADVLSRMLMHVGPYYGSVGLNIDNDPTSSTLGQVSLNLVEGVGISLVENSNNNSITISSESHHTVINKNTIVTTQHDTSLYCYDVQCDLSGSVLKLADLDEIVSSNNVFPESHFVWTKTLSETGRYAGICRVQSTNGRFTFKLDIFDAQENKTTTHYYGLVGDSPADSTFTFVTTCEWDIEVRLNPSNSRLLAFLKIPDNFEGTITLTPLKREFANQWLYTFDYSSGTNIRDRSWNIANGTTSVDTLTDLKDHVPETTDPNSIYYLRQPFGNYYVNVLGEFGNQLYVGSKISDSIINDYYLHTLEKRVNFWQVNSDWEATEGPSLILNKPTLTTVTFRHW